jgi:hypothetical protein
MAWHVRSWSLNHSNVTATHTSCASRRSSRSSDRATTTAWHVRSWSLTHSKERNRHIIDARCSLKVHERDDAAPAALEAATRRTAEALGGVAAFLGLPPHDFYEAMSWHVVPCNAICNAMEWNAMQCDTMECHVMQCNTITLLM